MLNQRNGRRAEQTALHHLQQQGLELVTSNFNSRFGEIDLIMTDVSAIHARILVFIEVRYRKSNQFGGAAASVSRTKQQRIARTAKWFMRVHPAFKSLPCRFDVVAMTGLPEQPTINWLKNAFDC